MAHWLDTYGRGSVGKVKKVPVKKDALVQLAFSMLNRETDALQAAGFNQDQVTFNLVKDWMESGAYTNTGAKVNNPGNLVYSSKDPLASKGPPMTGNPGYYFAAYSSLADYARALKRELSKAPGRPIDARGYPDMRDFVHRLKLNGYFGKESEASYLDKMKGAQQRLRILQRLEDDANQNINVPDKKDWWGRLPLWGKIGIGAAAALVFAKMAD